MADAADSDTFVVLKRRITEIEETVQQQPESSSDSLYSIIVPAESQPSPVVVSPPKEEQESMRSSPNFLKKVKCSSSASECTTGGAQELGFEENEERVDSVRSRITGCDTECGSGGSQRNSDSFARKIENLGSDVEKKDNFNMGLVSDGGLKIEEVEDSANGMKREKGFVETEVGFCGIQEFCNKVVSRELKIEENEKCEGKVEMDYSMEGDNVGGCATSSLAHLAEEEELLVGTGAESGGILEAKKRQLLAELKGGLIFENRNNVNNVTGSENTSVKNDVYKAIDGTAVCSIKIDGTALIEAVQIPKSGNGNGKNVERNGKKNEKQDGASKKPRRTRKKAKDVKMGSDMSVRQRNMTQFVVPQKDGNGIKIMYSREEMEALRFANIMEQHLVWRDIYTGFAPDLVKEYDELARMKHPKNIHSNFNPDRHFGRKTEVPVFRRETGPQNVDNELKNTEEDELENLNALDASGGLSFEVEDAYNYVEEYTEDEDSDEDYASIQRPAFLVEGEPDFDSGPPEDGLEYLRRVRWEAANIPKVKVAKLDGSKLTKEQSVYMPQIPDIANCAEHLLPSKHWEDSFLADFSNLRLTLSSLDGSSAKVSGNLQSIIEVQKQQQSVQLPEDITFTKLKDLGTDDADSYQHIDSSSRNNSVTQPPRLPNEDVEIKTTPSLSISAPSKYPIVNLSGNDPTLSTILGMDYVSRASTLRKRISLIESMDELSRNDCSWLFALCAAVDTPLHADTSAALRSLLRKCANLRAGKSELDDEVAMLNILATISGKYFGQSER
ncbi:hypothetical protein HS088_TW04G01265 [Tripterygium wilfordii]|uniref:Survival motor neuron interacting protein 1 n=1 Tax=Tripterygium wilfordii TaxID=458696 RepID=A0A7J7DSN4_TRIWF|nr:uncharacterized protein LOC119997436 [Tripterygium wilfordii]KAF5749299.1 hypothetical protein HS088_TW04G01265 [Tripterygium wilfordii]